MRIKKLFNLSACILLLCCFALAFSACSKDVTVTINDCGTKTDVEVKTGVTVSKAIEEAGIKLGDKDETEPAKDETIKDDTTDITIKRYAKVTVVKGNDKKEVELVGATVEDAVKKAGFTLTATDKVDPEKSSYLKDGMTITITEANKVTLTVDGKTTEVSTGAANVKDFLAEQKITLGKDDIVSEKLDAPIKNGIKITVKRVTFKEDKKTETIDFETEKKYSDTMDEGESEVEQKGVNGEKEVVYSVKYIDGKEDSREKKSEKVTKQPVNEVVIYGTKTETSQSNESSNDNSAEDNNANQSSGNESAPQQSGRTVVSKTPVYDCDGSGHGYYEIKYSDGTTEYEEF